MVVQWDLRRRERLAMRTSRWREGFERETVLVSTEILVTQSVGRAGVVDHLEDWERGRVSWGSWDWRLRELTREVQLGGGRCHHAVWQKSCRWSERRRELSRKSSPSSRRFVSCPPPSPSVCALFGPPDRSVHSHRTVGNASGG